MRRCAPAATSRQWISRRGIATGTRSKRSPAARAIRSSKSPGGRFSPPSARPALLPASDVGVALVNHHVTNRFGPAVLPALELRGGVPAGLRTLVVVPTLLTTPAEIEEQIERLEVRQLASSEDDLRFALLSDWTDAAGETAPDDDALLGTATEGIARLNRRYGSASGGDRFLLLHRRRVWN